MLATTTWTRAATRKRRPGGGPELFLRINIHDIFLRTNCRAPQKSHLLFENIDFFLRKLAAKVTGSARPGVIRETFQLFFRLIYKERGCEKKVVMTFDELP